MKVSPCASSFIAGGLIFDSSNSDLRYSSVGWGHSGFTASRCGSRADCGKRVSLSHRTMRSSFCSLAREEGEIVKIRVGPVRRCSEQTFSFKRLLGPSSVLVVVILAKPMGIVFESRSLVGLENDRVVVAKLIPGSNAERASRVAQMFEGGNQRRGSKVVVGGDVKPGDLLRATTTVDVLVDFFGLRLPQREMRLYEADGRPWNEIMAALGASFVADGPLTLVLERKC